ncbi:Long-chain-fatty-acid--CoA ligase [compost metagenome]|uniref:Long-chain-fatty-acid-CoA ligase n=1 Tax=Pseudomonas wadenswilerensis TaxID=1785161 RepID=A0A380T8Y9_9PSED|nr:malonyl-CoA synthase [Pseudomonas wadenswilerensis]SUQ65956.1 Long-chain-fatty-acid-CoA ligase [Pseudomonas wadenswilerensis]
MDGNLFHALFRSAPAAALLLESPTGEPLTYGQAFARSAQFANALRSLGVLPGDRVAVQVDKSVDALMLYLGTLRCGAVYLPLNTAYTPAELDYFLGDATPRVFVIRPQALHALSAIALEHGATLQTLAEQGQGSLSERVNMAATEFEAVPRASDDLAAILYTSGTTGRAKGAMLSHGNLLSNARTLCDAWRFSADDRLIHALPIFHAHGLFVATHTAMLAGASMCFVSRFDPLEIIALMQRSTVMMGVPTFYVRLLQHPGLDRQSTARMRLFISGSAPLLAETHGAFFSRTGHAILERYGMTETLMNTSNPYVGERIANTVGMPLPGVSIRITDPATGEPLAVDQVGMIEIQGPNVFKGYWRMAQKTADEFRGDGYFVSGDLGKIDAKGYLHIVGRSKDLVISGGYNIYPKEIETEIDQLQGVAESAVIGVPHSDFGEAVTAVVVCKPGIRLQAQALLDALQERLARYKQPKAIIFVDELPRNTMGKVQKNLLRDAYRDRFSAPGVA